MSKRVPWPFQGKEQVRQGKQPEDGLVHGNFRGLWDGEPALQCPVPGPAPQRESGPVVGGVVLDC